MSRLLRVGQIRESVVGGEVVRAYVPSPLPPNPALDLDRIQKPLERANQAIGRLDGIASLVPSLDLFLYHYVRKEALVSSQIEGTQSSLYDLLLYEQGDVPGVPVVDVQEVIHYVAAMKHGLRRLDQDGFPLSMRLVREFT